MNVRCAIKQYKEAKTELENNAIKLYNKIMSIKSDMSINPNKYSDERVKDNYYELIQHGEHILYKYGFIIDTHGILKTIDK